MWEPKLHLLFGFLAGKFTRRCVASVLTSPVGTLLHTVYPSAPSPSLLNHSARPPRQSKITAHSDPSARQADNVVTATSGVTSTAVFTYSTWSGSTSRREMKSASSWRLSLNEPLLHHAEKARKILHLLLLRQRPVQLLAMQGKAYLLAENALHWWQATQKQQLVAVRLPAKREQSHQCSYYP